MNEIERVIEVAKKEIGYLEKKSNSQLDDKTANAGNGNYTKYARDLDAIIGFYNGKKNGYSWCDIFVDWCFVQAFGFTRALELLCQPKGSCGAGVGYSAQYYKQKNQFFTSNPKVGDQVFYSKYSHTGLVVKVDSKYVYVVEGNTGSPVNGVKEKTYVLNSTSIIGYGRPNYNDSEIVQETQESVTEPIKTTENEKVDILLLVKKTIRGDFGNGDARVKALGEYYDEIQRQVNLNLQHKTVQWDNIKLY